MKNRTNGDTTIIPIGVLLSFQHKDKKEGAAQNRLIRKEG